MRSVGRRREAGASEPCAGLDPPASTNGRIRTILTGSLVAQGVFDHLAVVNVEDPHLLVGTDDQVVHVGIGGRGDVHL